MRTQSHNDRMPTDGYSGVKQTNGVHARLAGQKLLTEVVASVDVPDSS